MLIKFDMDSDLYRQIEELVKNGKYSDLYQFVKLAITNQLQEEQTGTQQKPQVQSLASKFEQTKEQLLQDILRSISDIPLEKSQLPPPQESLIWIFYNRFFPIKVVIRHLATMIKPESTWIELGKFQEDAYIFAEIQSSKLREYETENNLSRNQKLSTGLPLPLSELKTARGFQRKKVESKIIASKLRFIDQFIGRLTKKEYPYVFKGAGFSMNLIGVKVENGICYITLTDNGREFALMENPILDEDIFDSPFSDGEVKFILDKIISRFGLEKIIVDKIVDELKEGPLTSDQIDQIFKEEKLRHYKDTVFSTTEKRNLEESITSERVATMGRLSELRIVNWEIDSMGKSKYSLNKKLIINDKRNGLQKV